ncbi:hypothetical protein F2P81_004537 [Scophthalmus maximus]|uniref:Uncharacterized protein n=1 Tax=Scophthalmus maximus TaxID=52904 RepID=A0A6A4THG9_SCOMX|nr:hypothetical protein F2P81_004537 [Scophthalmus maximus]
MEDKRKKKKKQKKKKKPGQHRDPLFRAVDRRKTGFGDERVCVGGAREEVEVVDGGRGTCFLEGRGCVGRTGGGGGGGGGSTRAQPGQRAPGPAGAADPAHRQQKRLSTVCTRSTSVNILDDRYVQGIQMSFDCVSASSTSNWNSEFHSLFVSAYLSPPQVPPFRARAVVPSSVSSVAESPLWVNSSEDRFFQLACSRGRRACHAIVKERAVGGISARHREMNGKNYVQMYIKTNYTVLPQVLYGDNVKYLAERALSTIQPPPFGRGSPHDRTTAAKCSPRTSVIARLFTTIFLATFTYIVDVTVASDFSFLTPIK